jgi:hypothetical protein
MISLPSFKIPSRPISVSRTSPFHHPDACPSPTVPSSHLVTLIYTPLFSQLMTSLLSHPTANHVQSSTSSSLSNLIEPFLVGIIGPVSTFDRRDLNAGIDILPSCCFLYTPCFQILFNVVLLLLLYFLRSFLAFFSSLVVVY